MHHVSDNIKKAFSMNQQPNWSENFVSVIKLVFLALPKYSGVLTVQEITWKNSYFPS